MSLLPYSLFLSLLPQIFFTHKYRNLNFKELFQHFPGPIPPFIWEMLRKRGQQSGRMWSIIFITSGSKSMSNTRSASSIINLHAICQCWQFFIYRGIMENQLWNLEIFKKNVCLVSIVDIGTEEMIIVISIILLLLLRFVFPMQSNFYCLAI
jgi:hypothetical protein